MICKFKIWHFVKMEFIYIVWQVVYNLGSWIPFSNIQGVVACLLFLMFAVVLGHSSVGKVLYENMGTWVEIPNTHAQSWYSRAHLQSSAGKAETGGLLGFLANYPDGQGSEPDLISKNKVRQPQTGNLFTHIHEHKQVYIYTKFKL